MLIGRVLRTTGIFRKLHRPANFIWTLNFYFFSFLGLIDIFVAASMTMHFLYMAENSHQSLISNINYQTILAYRKTIYQLFHLQELEKT